ncbi:TIR domain-containing protein [Bartonella sp. B39]
MRRLGIYPYILKGTDSGSLTIIESLEREICTPTRFIKFGIVLLTPNDMGYAKSEGETKVKSRARQNIILEMGMLVSALSRKNVVILVKQDTEIPSDVYGIIYLPFKNHVKEIASKLIGRLSESGFNLGPSAISMHQIKPKQRPRKI